MEFNKRLLYDEVALNCNSFDELKQLNEWAKREKLLSFTDEELYKIWNTYENDLCVCYRKSCIGRKAKYKRMKYKIVSYTDSIDLVEGLKANKKIKVALLLIEAERPIMLKVLNEDGTHKEVLIEAVSFDEVDKKPYISAFNRYSDIIL